MIGLNDQVVGHWLSANKSVIYVDMISRKAEAIREGTTRGIEQNIFPFAVLDFQ